MTCRVGEQPGGRCEHPALLDAQTPVVTVVGKTSMLHVREVLRTTPEENLRIIRESLAYLKAHGREVIYDAEHFFDGYKLDPDYALQTLQRGARWRRGTAGAVRYQRRHDALGSRGAGARGR